MAILPSLVEKSDPSPAVNSPSSAMTAAMPASARQFAPRAPGVSASTPSQGSAIPLSVSPRGGENSRSEEHTSELQSLMRISYAVFCLKKQKTIQQEPYDKSNTAYTQNK